MQAGDEQGVDFDELNRRYAEERAKRRRDEALGQYHAMTGKISCYARDPNADPGFTRDAV